MDYKNTKNFKKTETINLLQPKKEKNLDFFYKEQYRNWRKIQKDVEAKFFIINKEFDSHLKDISPGALKLFLYYGFCGKNETGESWHSIDTISKYFDVSSRTINTWNAELEERGLISRSIKGGRNKTTYLLPLSLNFFTSSEDNTNTLDLKDITRDDFKEVFGEVSHLFHIFQWRKSGESDKFDHPYNTLIIIFSKRYENSSIYHHTAFEYTEDKDFEVKYAIDIDNFRDEICTFESEYLLPDIALKPQGIAVNSKYNIKNTKSLKTLYDIISQLIHPDMDLNHFATVTLIKRQQEE